MPIQQRSGAQFSSVETELQASLGSRIGLGLVTLETTSDGAAVAIAANSVGIRDDWTVGNLSGALSYSTVRQGTATGYAEAGTLTVTSGTKADYDNGSTARYFQLSSGVGELVVFYLDTTGSRTAPTVSGNVFYVQIDISAVAATTTAISTAIASAVDGHASFQASSKASVIPTTAELRAIGARVTCDNTGSTDAVAQGTMSSISNAPVLSVHTTGLQARNEIFRLDLTGVANAAALDGIEMTLDNAGTPITFYHNGGSGDVDLTLTGASASALAAEIEAKIDGNPNFSASADGVIVTITTAATGVSADPVVNAAFDAATATLVVAQQGSAGVAAVFELNCTGVTSSDLQGLYCDVPKPPASANQGGSGLFRCWFSYNGNGSAPTAGAGNTLVEVILAADDTDAQVADAFYTALNALTDLTATDRSTTAVDGTTLYIDDFASVRKADVNQRRLFMKATSTIIPGAHVLYLGDGTDNVSLTSSYMSVATSVTVTQDSSIAASAWTNVHVAAANERLVVYPYSQDSDYAGFAAETNIQADLRNAVHSTVSNDAVGMFALTQINVSGGAAPFTVELQAEDGNDFADLLETVDISTAKDGSKWLVFLRNDATTRAAAALAFDQNVRIIARDETGAANSASTTPSFQFMLLPDPSFNVELHASAKYKLAADDTGNNRRQNEPAILLSSGSRSAGDVLFTVSRQGATVAGVASDPWGASGAITVNNGVAASVDIETASGSSLSAGAVACDGLLTFQQFGSMSESSFIVDLASVYYHMFDAVTGPSTELIRSLPVWDDLAKSIDNTQDQTSVEASAQLAYFSAAQNGVGGRRVCHELVCATSSGDTAGYGSFSAGTFNSGSNAGVKAPGLVAAHVSATGTNTMRIEVDLATAPAWALRGSTCEVSTVDFVRAVSGTVNGGHVDLYAGGESGGAGFRFYLNENSSKSGADAGNGGLTEVAVSYATDATAAAIATAFASAVDGRDDFTATRFGTLVRVVTAVGGASTNVATSEATIDVPVATAGSTGGSASSLHFLVPMASSATQGIWFGYSGDTVPTTGATADSQVTIAYGDSTSTMAQALDAVLAGLTNWSCPEFEDVVVVDSDPEFVVNLVDANVSAVRALRTTAGMYLFRMMTNVVATSNGTDTNTFVDVGDSSGSPDVAAWKLTAPIPAIDLTVSTYITSTNSYIAIQDGQEAAQHAAALSLSNASITGVGDFTLASGAQDDFNIADSAYTPSVANIEIDSSTAASQSATTSLIANCAIYTEYSRAFTITSASQSVVVFTTLASGVSPTEVVSASNPIYVGDVSHDVLQDMYLTGTQGWLESGTFETLSLTANASDGVVVQKGALGIMSRQHMPVLTAATVSGGGLSITETTAGSYAPAQVDTVDFRGVSTSADLDGEKIQIYTPESSFYIWFDIDDSGTADPTGDGTSIEITTLATGVTSADTMVATVLAVLEANSTFTGLCTGISSGGVATKTVPTRTTSRSADHFTARVVTDVVVRSGGGHDSVTAVTTDFDEWFRLDPAFNVTTPVETIGAASDTLGVPALADTGDTSAFKLMSVSLIDTADSGSFTLGSAADSDLNLNTGTGADNTASLATLSLTSNANNQAFTFLHSNGTATDTARFMYYTENSKTSKVLLHGFTVAAAAVGNPYLQGASSHSGVTVTVTHQGTPSTESDISMFEFDATVTVAGLAAKTFTLVTGAGVQTVFTVGTIDGDGAADTSTGINSITTADSLSEAIRKIVYVIDQHADFDARSDVDIFEKIADSSYATTGDNDLDDLGYVGVTGAIMRVNLTGDVSLTADTVQDVYEPSTTYGDTDEYVAAFTIGGNIAMTRGMRVVRNEGALNAVFIELGAVGTSTSINIGSLSLAGTDPTVAELRAGTSSLPTWCDIDFTGVTVSQLDGQYFWLPVTSSTTDFCKVWFDQTGSTSEPIASAPSGSTAFSIEVDVSSDSTAAQVAASLRSALITTHPGQFSDATVAIEGPDVTDRFAFFLETAQTTELQDQRTVSGFSSNRAAAYMVLRQNPATGARPLSTSRSANDANYKVYAHTADYMVSADVTGVSIFTRPTFSSAQVDDAIGVSNIHQFNGSRAYMIDGNLAADLQIYTVSVANGLDTTRVDQDGSTGFLQDNTSDDWSLSTAATAGDLTKVVITDAYTGLRGTPTKGTGPQELGSTVFDVAQGRTATTSLAGIYVLDFATVTGATYANAAKYCIIGTSTANGNNTSDYIKLWWGDSDDAEPSAGDGLGGTETAVKVTVSSSDTALDLARRTAAIMTALSGFSAKVAGGDSEDGTKSLQMRGRQTTVNSIALNKGYAAGVSQRAYPTITYTEQLNSTYKTFSVSVDYSGMDKLSADGVYKYSALVLAAPTVSTATSEAAAEYSGSNTTGRVVTEGNHISIDDTRFAASGIKVRYGSQYGLGTYTVSLGFSASVSSYVSSGGTFGSNETEVIESAHYTASQAVNSSTVVAKGTMSPALAPSDGDTTSVELEELRITFTSTNLRDNGGNLIAASTADSAEAVVVWSALELLTSLATTTVVYLNTTMSVADIVVPATKYFKGGMAKASATAKVGLGSVVASALSTIHALTTDLAVSADTDLLELDSANMDIVVEAMPSFGPADALPNHTGIALTLTDQSRNTLDVFAGSSAKGLSVVMYQALVMSTNGDPEGVQLFMAGGSSNVAVADFDVNYQGGAGDITESGSGPTDKNDVTVTIIKDGIGSNNTWAVAEGDETHFYGPIAYTNSTPFNALVDMNGLVAVWTGGFDGLVAEEGLYFVKFAAPQYARTNDGTTTHYWRVEASGEPTYATTEMEILAAKEVTTYIHAFRNLSSIETNFVYWNLDDSDLPVTNYMDADTSKGTRVKIVAAAVGVQTGAPAVTGLITLVSGGHNTGTATTKDMAMYEFSAATAALLGDGTADTFSFNGITFTVTASATASLGLSGTTITVRPDMVPSDVARIVANAVTDHADVGGASVMSTTGTARTSASVSGYEDMITTPARYDSNFSYIVDDSTASTKLINDADIPSTFALVLMTDTTRRWGTVASMSASVFSGATITYDIDGTTFGSVNQAGYLSVGAVTNVTADESAGLWTSSSSIRITIADGQADGTEFYLVMYSGVGTFLPLDSVPFIIRKPTYDVVGLSKTLDDGATDDNAKAALQLDASFADHATFAWNYSDLKILSGVNDLDGTDGTDAHLQTYQVRLLAQMPSDFHADLKIYDMTRWFQDSRNWSSSSSASVYDREKRVLTLGNGAAIGSEMLRIIGLPERYIAEDTGNSTASTIDDYVSAHGTWSTANVIIYSLQIQAGTSGPWFGAEFYHLRTRAEPANSYRSGVQAFAMIYDEEVDTSPDEYDDPFDASFELVKAYAADTSDSTGVVLGCRLRRDAALPRLSTLITDAVGTVAGFRSDADGSLIRPTNTTIDTVIVRHADAAVVADLTASGSNITVSVITAGTSSVSEVSSVVFAGQPSAADYVEFTIGGSTYRFDFVSTSGDSPTVRDTVTIGDSLDATVTNFVAAVTAADGLVAARAATKEMWVDYFYSRAPSMAGTDATAVYPRILTGESYIDDYPASSQPDSLLETLSATAARSEWVVRNSLNADADGLGATSAQLNVLDAAGASDWTLLDGSTTALRIGSSDAPALLVVDTSGDGVTMSGTLGVTGATTLTGNVSLGADMATTTASTWTLLDNDASALTLDSAGKTGILQVVTSDSSEGVTMSGTLDVTGATTSGTLDVIGATTLDQLTVSTSAAISLTSSSNVAGSIALSGTGTGAVKIDGQTVIIGTASGDDGPISVAASGDVRPINLGQTGSTTSVWGTLDVQGATLLDQVTITTDDGAFDVSGANASSLKSDAASSSAIVLEAENVAGGVKIDGNTIAIGTKSSGDTGAISLGTEGTRAVNISSTGNTTTVQGLLTLNEAVQANSTLTVGQDGTGKDVQLFGATNGKSLLWDQSADTLIVTGQMTVSDNFTASSGLSAGTSRITSVAEPTASTDAATKNYVDSVAQGLRTKESVRAASTANGALATAFEPGDTMDGVLLAANDRIVLKDQTDASENGIYTVNGSGAPTRAVDMNSDTHDAVSGSLVYVREGDDNGLSSWVCTNVGTFTIGTTSMTWAQFNGTEKLTAGKNMNKDDTTDTLNLDTSLLLIDSVTNTAGALEVSADGAVTIESSSGAISIGAASDNNALNLGTSGSRIIKLGGTGSTSMALDAGVGGFSLLADTTITMDSGTGMSLDAGAASNFSTSSGSLTLSSSDALTLTAGANSQWTVNDNDATALQIGSTDTLNLLTLDTRDSAERVVVNGAVVMNRLQTSASSATTSSDADIVVPATYSAYTVTIDGSWTADHNVELPDVSAIGIGSHLWLRINNGSTSGGIATLVVGAGSGDTFLGHQPSACVVGSDRSFELMVVGTGAWVVLSDRTNLQPVANAGSWTTASANWIVSNAEDGLLVTRLLVDLSDTILVSATQGDAIGKDGAQAALGQLTAAVVGRTFVSGTMQCLVAPTTGSADIDLVTATSGTVVEDGLVTAVDTLVARNANWEVGDVHDFAVTSITADKYLYLVNGAASGAGTYGAGKFLITFRGLA